MLNWFRKEEPKKETPKPVEPIPSLRLDFFFSDKGARHVVKANDGAIEALDAMFKDTDKLYDTQMDERTKIAFFLQDYLNNAMEAGRLLKNYKSMIGQPYFVATFSLNKDSDVGVETDYNKHFIYDLDRAYAKNQAPYDPTAEDHAKIAVYLFDIVNQIAAAHLPNDEEFDPDDPMRYVPALAVSGGKENKQVVDLGRRDATTESVIDVVR